MSERDLLLFTLPVLGGCAAMGLPVVEALALASAVAVPAAVVSGKDSPPAPEVYGTYKEGFWFDRELYFVWVIAGSPQEAEQVARNTAINSCTERAGIVRPDFVNAWQERALFIPVKVDRFLFEMRFRCVRETSESP